MNLSKVINNVYLVLAAMNELLASQAQAGQMNQPYVFVG